MKIGEMKHLIIGTAGHVDHGKTALVKALTNIDCDTHKEEKERGITINLGFSYLNLPSGASIGIIDVPGHKDFIKTMVAGAYGIDIALLVIAADSGIMSQTEEHFRIIEMLGVEHGIVVITKTDLVDEETVEYATLEITEYLEGTSLEHAPVVPVSVITGKGLEQLVTTIETILSGVKKKQTGDLFRMYIDRIFNVKGIGYVVTGSVLDGSTKSGQDIYLLPGKSKKIKVRNIERHGVSVEKVFQGDRAALNLSGLKPQDYKRGMVLCSKQLDDTQMIDATLKMFDPTAVIRVWSNVIFYTGTFETVARLHLLDKEELHPGNSGFVQVHFSRPALLVVNDKFIIRNSSNDRTLGGGTIIDTTPLHHKKRTNELIRDLKELVDATINNDNTVNLVKIELNKINTPVFASTIASSIDKPMDVIVEDIKADSTPNVLMFKSSGQMILIRPELDQQYMKLVLEELETFHKKNPILEEGLEANEFTGKFNFGKNESGKLYIEILMDRIHQKGLTKKAGDTWAMSNHTVTIDKKTQNELDWLEKIFKNSGMDLPVANKIQEAAYAHKISKDRLKMFLKYLSYNQILVYHEGDFVHQTIVDEVRKKLLKKISIQEKGINEKEFRELIHGTRKFVQVMLGLLLNERIITKPTFYILITDKGRKILEKIS